MESGIVSAPDRSAQERPARRTRGHGCLIGAFVIVLGSLLALLLFWVLAW